ncbi:MAG TPA: phosphate ABC transporter permease subunit PstC [Actinomycetota bacterium]
MKTATPPVVQPPLFTGKRRSETAARWVSTTGAAALLVVLAYMILRLFQTSWPVWKAHGVGWVFSSSWNPAAGVFGALPFIYGTVVTSAIALVVATPIGIGTALFVSEVAPVKLRRPVASVLDLLAAVPSVIYGLWGILVFVPLIRPLQNWLATHFGGHIPFLAPPSPGPGFLAAGLVLAIMVLPTISAVSREVFLTIPQDVREAAYALGSTRWETIRIGVLPPARSGIIGGVILGLGRALGETVAVLLVIGDTPTITKSLFSPGYSMAAVIANEFREASEPLHIEALIGIALVLFLITVVIDMLARLLVHRTGARS